MTYETQNTAFDQLAELLAGGGDDRFLRALELLVNVSL